MKAGDTVTLPIPVGQVVENQETGFRTRLESWTETVPEGKNPVEFSYATDEWGNTEYSFTMPEREVTMTGTWEQVYSVVYCDGVEDEELFRDEWHAVNYGEPTPEFNGGEDPVREGYVFTGWDPAVAETVTEDVEYYAQWAECAHENFEYTENWAASGYRGWAEQIAGNDYKHTALYAKHHEAKCLACGALFSHVYEEGAEEADHAYDNGKCTQCAYACSHADKTNGACDACGTEIFCEHPNKTEVETGVYKLAADSQWTPDGMGYHVGMAQLGTLYHCGECNRNLFVPLEDAKEYRFKCEQDTNEDGLCDVCFGKMPDTAAPRFQFVGLEPPTGVVGCEVKVTARFTDETELSRYEVLINDVVKATGELSGTEGEFELTFTDLEVGEHIFKIQVYDAAGNRSKYEFPPVTITAANTAPVISITSSAGENFRVGTEVTFSVEVTDNGKLAKVELYVDGKVEKTVVTGDPLCMFPFTTDALTVGEHTVRVVAEDKDGLTAEKSLTVTVVPCTHEHKKPTGGHEEELIKREALNDYKHVDYVIFYDEMECPDCGEVFIDELNQEFEDDHTYVNGKCTECEHVCQHPAWNGNVCDACEHVCMHESWNEDGTCAKCGTACEHPSIRPDEESFTDKVYGEADPIPLEENKAIRNERHLRYYTAMADYYCETCGVFVKKDQVSGQESEAHAFGDDYACDLCGYEKLHITRQPENTWAYVGENAMFTVEAVGDELTYTWYYKNASASSFSESSVKAASIGVQMTEARDGRQMYCVVKDKYGNTVKTDTVAMTLRTKLEITKQPVNAWAYDGESAKVSVTAAGDGLTYQWYYKNVGDEEFTASTTKTASYSLKMNADRDGHQVYCEVIDAHGNILKSDTVTLDTRFKPVITKQPESVTASDLEKISFSIEATGDGLTYQWYYRNAGTTTWKEAASKDVEYNTEMQATRDGRQVYCEVKDAYGNSISSNTVTMRLPVVKISTQPVSTWAYDGENVAVGVEATGDGLTYTWYYKNASSSSFKQSSLTTPIYAVKATESTDGRQVYCVVTDAYGNTAKSDTVTLDTRFVLSITQHPQSVTASAGKTITFTVTAMGDGLEYRWYYRNAGMEEWTEAASTKASYSTEMQAARNGCEVYCVVKDAYGNSESSAVAKMSLPVVEITKQPTNAAAYEGEKVTISVTATGDGLEYAWYYKNVGESEFTEATIETETYSLIVNEECDGRQVYCRVTDKYGRYEDSETVTLTTKYKPIITKQPENVMASAGEVVTFSVEATGEGPFEYQWYYRNQGTTTWKAASSTQASYAIDMQAAKNGRQVYCKVTDVNGKATSSDTVTMSLPMPEIKKNPESVTVAMGDEVTFIVEATGDGPLEYQWYYRNVGTTTWKVSSTVEATYKITMTEDRAGREVYCKVTDAYGQTVKSATATMFLPAPEITKQPENVTASIGEAVIITVEVKGDGLKYQWYYRNAGTTTWKTSSTTGTTYETTMTEDRAGREVYCKVTDVCGRTLSSEIATMILKATEEPDTPDVPATPLEIISHPSSVTASAEESVTFTVEAKGDGLKYQWYYRNAGATTWTTSATKEATYKTSITKDRDGREVYCEVKDAYGNTVKSNTATMNLPGLEITKQPENVTVSMGEDAVITVGAKGDGLKYQWYYRNAGTTTWKTSSTTGTTYEITMTEDRAGREVYCKVTDAYGRTASSEIATMILKATEEPDTPDIPETPLEITSQPGNVTAADGEEVTLTVKAKGDGLKYQWYYRNAGTTEWKVASSTSSTYTFGVTAARNGREIYCKIVDAYDNTVNSNTVKITVLANEQQTPLEITSHPSSVTAADGETVSFFVKATGDGLKYQWYYRNAGTTAWKEGNSTSASYSTSITEARDGREVYCKVIDAYGNTAKSNTAKMNLKATSEPEVPFEITSQPSDVTAADGNSVTVSVKATGDSLKYQWYYRNAGTSEWKTASSTSSKYTFTVTAARDGREIYCKITSNGQTLKSRTLTVTVK